MTSDGNVSLADIENVDNLFDKYAIPSPGSTQFGMVM